MKYTITLLFSVLSLLASAQTKWNYPPTPKIPVYDTIWGKVIKDDYRWMENTNDSAVTKSLQVQADFTNNLLAQIPGRDKLEKEYKQSLDNMGKSTFPWVSAKVGAVMWVTEPEWQTPKLYFLRNATGKMELLADPEKIEQGKVWAIDGWTPPTFSKNEKYLIVSFEREGSKPLHKIWDVQSGKFLEEDFKFISVRWARTDNEIICGKLFTEDPKSPDYYKHRKTYLHKLGTPHATDVEIMNDTMYPEIVKDSGYAPFVFISPKSPYIIAILPYVQSLYLQTFVATSQNPRALNKNWKPLCTSEDQVKGDEGGLLLNGDKAFFLTSKNSSAFEVRMAKMPEENFASSKLIFKPENGWVITGMNQTNNYLIINTIKNGTQSRLYAYHIPSGKTRMLPIDLKGIYSVNAHSAKDGLIIEMTGWSINDGTYFNYDLTTNKLSPGKFSKPNAVDGNLMVIETEAASHDGVKVPVSIVYDKRYFKKDGNHRTEIKGYGAYGIPSRPYYIGYERPKLDRGFAIVTAHVRGGGEKGEAWHIDGQKKNKPNTWKDLIATAEYLIANKYTSSDKLIISGVSAGGILIGRAVTERPDLFAVAIPQVGIMNSLRGEFSGNPVGTRNEFGTVANKDEAEWLYQMDAMHHVREGVKYPAQLITAGYNDPRVTVWLPAKYAATMQACNAGQRPQLLHVDFNAGHFGGDTMDDHVKMEALKLAFMLWQTGHPDFQPKK